MDERTFLPAILEDERNSALFYSHLSSLCTEDAVKTMLENIAVECGIFSYKLIKHCEKLNIGITDGIGRIERNIPLSKGISWAKDVEKASINTLSARTKTDKLLQSLCEAKKNRLIILERCEKLLK